MTLSDMLCGGTDMEEIITDRLVLRRFRETDANAVSAIAKYIAAKSSKTTMSQDIRLPSSIWTDHTPLKSMIYYLIILFLQDTEFCYLMLYETLFFL